MSQEDTRGATDTARTRSLRHPERQRWKLNAKCLDHRTNSDIGLSISFGSAMDGFQKICSGIRIARIDPPQTDTVD
jgi:hypothetical protein